MFLKNLEEVVMEGSTSEFVKPLYNGYSLVNTLNTILNAFGVETKGPMLDKSISDKIPTAGVKKVVLVLIDGFGYHYWLDFYKKSKFLSALAEKGVVAPITSGFPTTTPAALTTINTGLTTEQHALPGMFVYYKEIGQIIKTLPFIGLDQRSLLEKGVSPSLLYEGETTYQALGRHGVKSYKLLGEDIRGGAYNKLFEEYSQIIAYRSGEDLKTKLKNTIEKDDGRAFFYVYIDKVDKCAHGYGTDSKEAESAVYSTAKLFEDLIKTIDKNTAKETLIIVTADHGHVSINPDETIYLNGDKKLDSYYALDGGRPILPTGNPRNVFLHIKDGELENAYKYLSTKFKGKAEVVKTAEALKTGLFGYGKPNAKFLERMGNLMILPSGHNSIWYDYGTGYRYGLKSEHGGISKDEMLIPLAIARLSDLTEQN